MQSKPHPFSIRLSPDVHERLEHCAERLKMKKHTLAQDAIEAAVEAIERNGYKIVVPIQFEVTHVAVSNPRPTSVYPPHREETSLMEERPGKPKRAA